MSEPHIDGYGDYDLMQERFRCVKLGAILTRAACRGRHLLELNSKSTEQDRACRTCEIGAVHKRGEAHPSCDQVVLNPLIRSDECAVSRGPGSKGAAKPIKTYKPLKLKSVSKPVELATAWTTTQSDNSDDLDVDADLQSEADPLWGGIEPTPGSPERLQEASKIEHDLVPVRAVVTVPEPDPETRAILLEGMRAWLPENQPVTAFSEVEKVARHLAKPRPPRPSRDSLDRGSSPTPPPERNDPPVTKRPKQRRAAPAYPITYEGRTMAPSDWAAEFGVTTETIRERHRRGKPLGKYTYQSSVRVASVAPHNPSNAVPDEEVLRKVVNALGYALTRETFLGQSVLVLVPIKVSG